MPILLVVLKKERKLILYSQGQVLKTYPISLGSEPVGPKTHQGDQQNSRGTLHPRPPQSQEPVLSLHSHLVSKPRPGAERAKAGNLSGRRCLHHGLPNGFGWLGSSQRRYDWTDGCIAVPMPKWMRSGERFPMELRLRFDLELWSSHQPPPFRQKKANRTGHPVPASAAFTCPLIYSPVCLTSWVRSHKMSQATLQKSAAPAPLLALTEDEKLFRDNIRQFADKACVRT